MAPRQGSRQQTLHALLIVFTILALGVASIGLVVSSRKKARESVPDATGPTSQPVHAAATLEKPPPSAQAPSTSTSKAQAVPGAPVVIPPSLLLKLEKRYRNVSPADMQIARSQLEEKLRVQTQNRAPEAALQELRCEIQWIVERTATDEGREEGTNR
jgi:hypothetical protein